MGLLDDAIREHLDLKRQRGADPGEVAREQREALTPVPRDGTDVPEDGGTPDVEPPLAAGEQAVVGDAPPVGDEGAESPLAGDAGETAELDMRTVLGEEGDGTAAPAHGVGGEGSSGEDGEDSLEWEIPGEAAAQSGAEAPEDSAEAVEDVLEETPDFLRETPEEDRLWFEQRPPRDFDFDK
jgi:hypothetical protein